RSSRRRRAAVGKQIILLLSGIPATGKSTFARYLVSKHGFAHYDLECDSRGWPYPGLKRAWDTDRAAFLTQVRQHHDRVVLDWGFPISCLSWVKELQADGVQLIWFDGDVGRSRQVFAQRGGIAVTHFDNQVGAIQNAGFPGSLQC